MQKGPQGHTWTEELLFNTLNGKTGLNEVQIFKSTISGRNKSILTMNLMFF